MSDLAQRIASGNATVGVMGLGYVGLPLLRAFWDGGFKVLGFDIDPEKVTALKAGQNYLRHLGDALVSDMKGSDRFDATSDASRLAEADALILCVPTPLDARLQPDLSFVMDTTRTVAKTLRKGQLVVLESTTYPGTTRGDMLPVLEATGLKLGTDFYLAYSPEREDPGRKDFSTQSIPKLVGGVDPVSGELSLALYRKAIKEVIPVSTAEVAEAAKLLENIYRAVNIALVNEMKVVLDAMNVDVWEVIRAAATKPFGFQAFYPGPGLGGHCIPIDPFYLTYKAREFGQSTRFIELAGEINRAMPAYVIARAVEALNDDGKPMRGSKVLVMGLAYKPDVDDCRESPSFHLIEQLTKLGAKVDYTDPHVPKVPRTREHPHIQMDSTPLTAANLAKYDCVLVATHHAAFDWKLVADNAKLVIDSRNAMRDVRGSARIVRA
ncbi:MAG: nucleotide sugar dehydrogenase [Polyangiales bacterium]|nr:nucleotide sugar dehydrogenase [Myxococcales bacterium]